jgi:hypothetical protein
LTKPNRTKHAKHERATKAPLNATAKSDDLATREKKAIPRNHSALARKQKQKDSTQPVIM